MYELIIIDKTTKEETILSTAYRKEAVEEAYNDYLLEEHDDNVLVVIREQTRPELPPYVFSVHWDADGEAYIGTCKEFPSLSHGDEDPYRAYEGIRELVRDVIEEMEVNRELIPLPSHTYRYQLIKLNIGKDRIGEEEVIATSDYLDALQERVGFLTRGITKAIYFVRDSESI